ncbi:MAG TPA: DUF429 domain-containing protein [Candidatus Yaniella excrementigallinarum]|nr:DUF429 domain-containing protein [Candidatus Yaniella excrementigallinarum]
MQFYGIDVAAQPKNTGLARLRDDDDILRVEAVEIGLRDDQLIQAVQDADITGVDVPFGWPASFIQMLQDHANATLQAPDITDHAWRRQLAMRATDLDVHQRTGLTPLSVSTNLIAYPAFRWAAIEARLRELGVDMARDGSGSVAEVYSAAALYCWGLPHRKYKGPQHVYARQTIVAGLQQVFPTLDWNGFESCVIGDDNALDAVLAGLITHQIAAGQCYGPAPHQRPTARIEGWIWIPHARTSTG